MLRHCTAVAAASDRRATLGGAFLALHGHIEAAQLQLTGIHGHGRRLLQQRDQVALGQHGCIDAHQLVGRLAALDFGGRVRRVQPADGADGSTSSGAVSAADVGARICVAIIIVGQLKLLEGCRHRQRICFQRVGVVLVVGHTVSGGMMGTN